MVQTITVSEAVLTDNLVRGRWMANFLIEDPNISTTEPNWWYPRVKLVENWLKDEVNRTEIPDDGAEEIICRQIQRGDIYPHVQHKCWKHILLELQDFPCFATLELDSARTVNTSPSRGKLRPGKELIILSDSIKHSNNETEGGTNSELPAVVGDNGEKSSTAGNISTRRPSISSQSGTTTTGKAFAAMSMMERQAEWLKKKQDKMEAERLRQEEEKEKELTFQPKILRRATFSGDRPTKDTPVGAVAVSGSFRSLAPRSDTLDSGRKSESNSSSISTTTTTTSSKPTTTSSKNKSIPKASKPRKKKQQQSLNPSQPIEISSELLSRMKSELEASIASGKTEVVEEQDDDDNNNNNSSNDLATTETIVQMRASPVKNRFTTTTTDHTSHLKSWSDQPIIGGVRIEFDSSDTKARLVLQDAAKFELSSMYRKTDKKAGREGVALHMGRREDTFEEEPIAILFDKEKVSELDATRWWMEHELRFTRYLCQDRSIRLS